jgi:hypothetical protein
MTTMAVDEEPCGWEEVYAACGCDLNFDEAD